MRYTIHIDELKDLVDRVDEELIILDVRTDREEGDIPGSIVLNVKEQIAGKEKFYAEPGIIAENLGKLGINEYKTLVFIDNGNYRPSAKALFALFQLGHKGELYILQGGYPAWRENPVVFYDKPHVKATTYHYHLREDAVLSFEHVQEELGKQSVSLIDSRSYERYAGIKEPKYERAGHIPGAVNYHAKEVLDASGKWHEREHLQNHFAALQNKDKIIVACGSGNSACLNAVALLEAGFKNVSLYPGGYSEWLEKGQEVATVDKAKNNEAD